MWACRRQIQVLWQGDCQTGSVLRRTDVVHKIHNHLEALAVHNRRARLVVLLLGDPHLLEGRERGKNRATNPDRVLTLWWGNDLNLHRGRGQSRDLLLHAVGNAWEHGGTTREHSVGVQVLTDIDVALHDRVVRALVDASLLHTEEGRLEEGLRAPETLVTNGNDLTVRKLVRLLERRGRGSRLHLSLEVEGDVRELLLDVTDNLTLSRRGERVTTLGEDLHHVVGEVTAGKVETEDGVWERVSFVDGDGVGDTIARVEHDTRGTARGVQREHGLDGDVHGGSVEGLEHDLRHLLTVGLWVEWGLSEEDRVLFRGNTELVVERVVPDLLHIVPVGHNTVLNGVLEREDTTLGLGLVADVRVLLAHTDHDTLVTRAANNRWEDGTRGVISGETSLAHAGSVVNHEGCDFVFCHFDELGWFGVVPKER
eukprot:m.141656 g.141656  ORF g.141656 m.141656 type:complete len:426 (-) comp11563_c0_seq1:2252-3529(-)